MENLGSAPQDLLGWDLVSEPVAQALDFFDLTPIGSLDPDEQVEIYSGSAAPATNTGAGVYQWGTDFKFRNADPTDFAQVRDDQAEVVDEVTCGGVSPTSTPTSGAATVTPTATVTPVPGQLRAFKDTGRAADGVGWEINFYSGEGCSGTPFATATTVLLVGFDDPGTAENPLVAPGTYSVSEKLRPGWDNIQPLCQDVIVVSGQVASVTFQNRRLGDADCDGDVDSIDAALILQHEAGLLDEVPCPDAADLNDDDEIDSRDATLVLQIVAGLFSFEDGAGAALLRLRSIW